jgi:hypothetical protein
MRVWPADPGAYGGRKARRAGAYDVFIPRQIAGGDFSLDGDAVAAVTEATRALQHLESPTRSSTPSTRSPTATVALAARLSTRSCADGARSATTPSGQPDPHDRAEVLCRRARGLPTRRHQHLAGGVRRGDHPGSDPSRTTGRPDRAPPISLARPARRPRWDAAVRQLVSVLPQQPVIDVATAQRLIREVACGRRKGPSAARAHRRAQSAERTQVGPRVGVRRTVRARRELREER